MFRESGNRSLASKILCVLLGMAFLTSAQSISWQTTHQGNSSGPCQLISNKITVTINPFHLDVEEEAEIATMGTVTWGDSRTLEITGRFQLSQGSALRSMLLWNGDEILKAKLKDKRAADSSYEQVVDRDKIPVVVRDPALIEYLGSNSYRFKIYPVEIERSRKLRILYSIPLQANEGGLKYELKTAFSYGCSSVPTQIPVEIKTSESVTSDFYLQHGDSRRKIQTGVTYLLSSQAFTYYGYPLYILPDTSAWNKAYVFSRCPQDQQDNFAVIFSGVPQCLRNFLNENGGESFVVESRICTGEKSYISEVPEGGSLLVYLKSKAPWDKKVYWTIYNEIGDIAAEHTQTIEPDTSIPEDSILPLIWAAKYSLCEGLGNLGGAFGFIDNNMSLLALESDVLNDDLRDQYEEEGVPPLLPDEIIIDPSKCPRIPEESIIFEFISTPVLMSLNSESGLLQIKILGNGKLILSFGSEFSCAAKIMLFDLRGRLIRTWSTGISGRELALEIPKHLKGTYIMRVIAGKKIIQKKFTLR